MHKMKVNCDMGEGFTDAEAKIMPLIDMANIACGGHTGDYESMMRTIALAIKHQVKVGAHPSYPDHAHFGRRSIEISPKALEASLIEQLEHLAQCCHENNINMTYIKPHGALYNDLVQQNKHWHSVLSVARRFNLPLIIQAHPENQQHKTIAQDYQVELIFEAFADRAYNRSGNLLARSQSNSVHSSAKQVVLQVRSLHLDSKVISAEGEALTVNAQTLCIHSDSKIALEAAIEIRDFLNSESLAHEN